MALEKKYYSGSQVFDIIKELPEKEFLLMLNTFARESGADVVEVVRCKDCVNCDHLVYKYDRNEEWWCGGLEVVPDGFCNYGERKEDVEIH